MSLRYRTLVALALITSASESPAAEISVPEDMSFEAALANASVGDIIDVAAGTLEGGSYSLPDGITLVSRVPHANHVEGLTIADATLGVIIEGFDVRGHGPYAAQVDGVWMSDSRVEFWDCVFEDLQTHFFGHAPIEVESSNVLFQGCMFRRNVQWQITEGAPLRAQCISSGYYGNPSTIAIQDCHFQEQAEPIFAWSANVTVRDTQFESCGPLLIDARQGLTMERCIVTGFLQTYNADVLSGYCWGVTGAIRALGAVTIQSNTFVDNRYDLGSANPCVGSGLTPADIPALIVLEPSATGEVTNNLFIGQPGAALDAPAQIAVACNDAYQSGDIHWRGDIGDVTGTQGNISAAPRFCHRAGGDFHLSEISPATAENSPCGPMGALGVACESPIPTRVQSLGSLKKLFGPDD